MSYRIHPFCAAFPDIEGEAFEELRESLKAGQQEPIWLYDDKWIIDGKNRLRAMQANKQPPEFEAWRPVSRDPARIEQEIRAFCIAKNLHRRHMTESQRAMVAARLATDSVGGDRKSENHYANLHNDLSRENAAEMLNVSSRSIANAEDVIENAPPEVVKAVESGVVSVSDAASTAGLPKSKQKAALSKVKSGKAKTMRAASASSRARKIVDRANKRRAEGNKNLPFDDSVIDGHFGKLIRAVDDRAKALKCANSSRHRNCLTQLNAFYDEYKLWRKETRQ